jgi:riboflavin kinase/FMN adenylyltransferase
MKTVTGIVQKGARRGKALGYPTANIVLPDGVESGIYAARVYLKKDEAPYMAAVFADEKRNILEAHVLDFSDDLYGVEIHIELHKKIRENKVFTNDDVLRAAIADDIAKVREYFTN